MVETVYSEHGYVSVIDIGGATEYWRIVSPGFIKERNVTITIVNLPGSGHSNAHPPFRYVEADGCDLSEFKAGSFHIAHSNSVLEHVGDWERMVRFAQEIRRLAPRYFVQTPNFWFPLEPHSMTPFFHWMPKPIRVWLVMHFSLGYWQKAATIGEAVQTVDSARLLNKKMVQALFQDAQIVTERILGLPKSFVAVKR